MTLWGGRFSQELDAAAWELNASLNIDRRLALQDVCGSLAWADAIHQAGVLTDDEHQRITLGLQAIRNEFTSGFFDFEHRDEDIHTAVERRLAEIAGPVAGKLHTGRSRNDQVATDLRLWILQTLPQINAAIAELQGALIDQAEGSKEVLMPGYTHLQRAQPILLAHWWLAHFWPLQRDRERLAQLAGRTAVMPLGSGALAGTPVNVDRNALTHMLGFVSASPNSIDAVSDRDFAAEFLFCAALTGIHLSKLAENIVLFTSAEFGFFELADSFTTGSSLMPQKKNPDVFELTRGKAGVLIGQLTSLLATLKSLPSTYDKDLQEDKVPVFTSNDVLQTVLPVLTHAISTISARPQRMLACIDASMMATDLADYLVGKGIPFRETHGIAGKAVRQAADQGLSLDKLPLEAYQAICPAFEADVYAVFDPLESVKRRSVQGGTAPQAVQAQIAQARAVQAVGHYHMVQPRCGND